MHHNRARPRVAALASLGLHLLVVAVAGRLLAGGPQRPVASQVTVRLLVAQEHPPPVARAGPEPVLAAPAPEPAPTPTPAPAPEAASTHRVRGRLPDPPEPGLPAAEHPLATLPAPAAPTAAEWAFAARYTLKNSKGYRHSWGRQVRSMMGTAVEGPDQGMVRFHVEIAPDGRLAKLETLWSTSPVAERLARKAIEEMPALPPTPTGRALVFERTISFSPFAGDDSPIYRNDCLPDPPVFRNPFAWDGRSPQAWAEPKPTEKLDPQALEECLKQLPRDSMEAESAHDQRLLDQGRSSSMGR